MKSFTKTFAFAYIDVGTGTITKTTKESSEYAFSSCAQNVEIEVGEDGILRGVCEHPPEKPHRGKSSDPFGIFLFDGYQLRFEDDAYVIDKKGRLVFKQGYWARRNAKSTVTSFEFKDWHIVEPDV